LASSIQEAIMTKYLSFPLTAALLVAISAQPVEAKRAYHHHASFYANHPHYHQRSQSSHRAHGSFVGHVAHYAVDYAVHYEIRTGVRHLLGPEKKLREHHDRRVADVTPIHPAPAPAAAPAPQAAVTSTDYPHEGPRLGVTLYPNEMRAFSVDNGSPAYVAGLEPNDIIEKAGDKPITNPGDFIEAVSAASPTKALHLTIRRDGKDYNATVLPGQPSPDSNLAGGK
jgi:membrane-associated protease RseP (regulator of RpoE activity)